MLAYTLMTDPANHELHAQEFVQLTEWFAARKRQLGMSEVPEGDLYDMHNPYNRHCENLFKEATQLWLAQREYHLSPGQLMAAFFGLPNPNRRVSMDA